MKPGKACSQLMEANDTGKTKIKVVRSIFRLKFVFNALKTLLNLYLNSLQSLSLFLFFEIRGVPSIKTCLEGGNLVNPMLMVYFGTPSLFITLWFGFDYGTNPPLGMLII
jgi:hypothetical protein